MSLQTPTTKDISDNIVAQLQATLNQTIPLMPKSFLRVLAKALAGVFVLLYKYGGFMFLQIFVRTATGTETIVNGEQISPLREWGTLIGVGDPASATNAELQIDITVESEGGILPSGTQLVGSTNGVTYLTISAVSLDSAVVPGSVIAASDQAGGGGSGDIGNLDPGAVISFANPLANVSRNAVVTSQVVTGANAESTDAYRQRIIDRFQKRPQGGAYADYEIWGEEPPGIINVFPYTGAPGEVNVYSEATPESSGSPDGIPTPAQLIEVFNSIELDKNGLASRRPANAFINSLPITRTGFDVRVIGISGVSDLAQVQSDIITALTGYFLGVEPFISGLSIPPRRDVISKTAVSALAEDIISANGGSFSGALFDITGGGSSLLSYTLGEGEKAKLVDVVFV